MKLLYEAGPCSGRAPALLVMLPGAYSQPAEFVANGFVEALRRQHIAADCVIADAHLGYLYDRSLVTRLREDIVGPARSQGYRQIWLVGISLGGFGALGYGTRHGAEIDGIVALAPYLGRRELQREIVTAGGPAAWQPNARPREADDLEHEIWQWLAAPPPQAPPVYLGFGTDDRLADSHRLLAGILSPERVTQVPGDHDWSAWLALWQQWLTRGMLPTDCRTAA